MEGGGRGRGGIDVTGTWVRDVGGNRGGRCGGGEESEVP